MAPRQSGRSRRRVILPLLLLVFILGQITLISATSNDDYEEIMKPLETVYDLTKYAATLIAGLVMLFAGITYITSGSDPGKREKAKNMVMYVFIGLMVIWAAPFVVKLILGD